MSSAIKLNTGLVDNPYIEFEDFTVDREVSYRYHLTAVDAAGNESAPYNSKAKPLPDIDTPLSPSTLWAANQTGALRLGWFGVNIWDIDGIIYEYYVESFDVVGNLSPASDVFSVASKSGVSHVDVWSLGYNGTNGWDSTTPLISGDAVVHNRDGRSTL